ncbi:hypothetical protein FO519_003359 [Halicephalobus sp. NKZ332]|nr:hypothetical protein FO519_003359 [Halicephalobus sp. NKZ332]
MSKNPEFFPFFVLPYVTEPLKHPVFKEFLSKKHIDQLQKKIVHLLQKRERKESTSSESDEDLQLASWKHAYDSRKLLSTVDKARIKDYQELQHDYYKIIDIAGELIECLEQTCHGKTISPDLFSKIAQKLIESNREAERRMQRSAMAVNGRTPPIMPISKRNRSLNRRPPENLTRKRPEPIKKSESTGNLIPADPKARSPPQPRINLKTNSPVKEFYFQLNFAKISNQLVKSPGTRSSALLLQALRYQLTKKPKLTDAVPILHLFTEKDILLLKNRKNSVVATIIAQAEQPETKEELSRFLNAISSFKKGRDYLLTIAQGKELLYQLALALRTKKLTNFAADHTLATLEKLSIRSSVQKELVLSGMIEWLISLFDGPLGNFGLEYGSALLANLCMNPVSQSTIFRYKDRLLELMKKLMNHPNLQLIPLTSNTLYVLFSFAKMRSAAKEFNFENVIFDRLKTIESPDLEAQLNVVLKVLQGEIEAPRRKESDEDEEEDYVEAEVDSTDTLIPTMTEMFGEMLLQKKYTLAGQQGIPSTDEAAPPGTVPRRQFNLVQKTVQKPIMRRGAPMNRKPIVRENPVPREPIPPGSPDQRMSSVSSFATFVAENDKRKPLLGHTGLKAAEGAAMSNEPEIYRSPKKSIPEPIKITEFSKFRSRRKSESSIIEESYLESPNLRTKVLSSTALDTAPVMGKINSRIPDDANVNEYTAVFGSRPKVARTPDQTLGNKKSTVFMF